MKTSIIVGFLSLGLVSAQAQIFRPEAVSGAAIGAIAGAIIGNNSGSLGHDAVRGAAWGAGTGFLVGSAIGRAENYRTWRNTQVPVPVGPRFGYRRAIAPRAYRRPISYAQGRPDYRGNGLVLGALAGAIIGNNSGSLGHNAWRGAAWGAGLGYILGTIAENNAPVASAPPVNYAPAVSVPATNAAPQQVTIINNYYNAPATAMSGANSLFGRN